MLRILARVILIPTLVVVGILTISVFSTSITHATINSQISFQGKLTNPDGTNVTNGNYSIVFTIYSGGTTAGGGTSVWTETQNPVVVTDGIFQVNLGSVTSLPGSVDFNAGNIYLAVKVGADPEMLPRIFFTASPYAFNSDKLGGLANTSLVQLAQGTQTDSSTTNASIAINKTGITAKIVDLQRGGASVFSINNDGSTAIKNSADSATEFDVQDSAGVNLFSIDALTDRLYVGDSTADGVGTLLVLDSKNTAGDPSGAFGGMYYNSSTNLYRCYRGVSTTVGDGAWENCSTQPIDRGYTQEEEFFSGGTTSGTIGKMGWNTSTIGAAPAYTYNNATPAVSAQRPGILRLRTPATANQGGTLSLGTASMAVGAEQYVKTAVAMATIGATTTAMRVGLHNETTAATRPTTGVWWEYDSAQNANWQYCYVNATPATVCAASTFAPVANTFNTLEIRVNTLGVGTSSVDYLVNGTKYSVSAITVNTTALVAPALSCYAQGAVLRDCFVDYFQIRGGSGALR